VLAYLLGNSRSWLWCITRDELRTFALPSRAELEESVAELQVLWSRPIVRPTDAAREEELSRLILGGAAEVLARHHEVAIIPDGALRHVPFAALRMPRAGSTGSATRLVETHVVSLLPSLQFTARSVLPAARGDGILLVGDPVSGGSSSAAFAPLPGSRREIAVIREIAADWRADTLTGVQATKTALLHKPLADYRVLHFATHARLDVESPQLSTIVLSRPASLASTEDSGLSLREIVGLDLSAETVVLSACEGSLGKQYRGQVSLGLSEAFLLAGAGNVVGSLWRVSDAAAQRYMTLFYDQYVVRGNAPAIAAQRAARTMMRDPKYAHPFYWAAFVVLTARSPMTGGRA